MKKLFTLIALLTMFFGAKAETIVDAEVDFSTVTEIPRFSWGGSESAFARLSLQNGCLHFESTEATDPSWDCQFFPIGGVDAEVGVVYTLHFKVKGDHNGGVSMLGFGQTPYGQFQITTDWVEGTVDYECTEANGNILMQCGDWIGTWDIAYLKITHEGKKERPATWRELLVNGNAEKSWAELGLDNIKWNDQENNYKVCFWTKEKGVNIGETGGSDPHPSEIITEADGNHAFICRATTADTEGDPSAWDNQIWFESPRAWKTGEQFKLSFRYKASEPVVTNTQVHHQNPSDYLFWQAIGDVSFTTEWQQFEQVVTVPSDANGMWSIAFNLNPNVKTPVDFYIDDLSWCEMELDHGYFVTATNTETSLVEYDFDTATEFVWDEEWQGYVARVGTEGKQDSWVNEIMLSTVRGNDRQFKANTLKVKGAVRGNDYNNVESAPSAKIKLPSQGVWDLVLVPEQSLLAVIQVEGDPFAEPIEIVPNPTEIVVNAVERDYTAAEAEALGLEGEFTGQPWDNQFIIMANRELTTGEETIIEFDYVATSEANTNTQCGGSAPGAYVFWNCLGDVKFTTEAQHFSKAYTIPANEGNEITTQSITFNMAVIKEANTYSIKNVVWKLADDSESLISMETGENFYVKTGAGTQPVPVGIVEVVAAPAANVAIYNLAGQKLSAPVKGINIKNGQKFIIK